MPSALAATDPWPELPLAAWQDTCETLHRWTQMAGKVRLALTPRSNHWWNVALYVTARGLTTSPIPYQGAAFELQFDFLSHQLLLLTSRGGTSSLPLAPQSCATFHERFLELLAAAGIAVHISPLPCEIPGAVPFDQDHAHASYDPEYAQRFWRVLLSAQRVLSVFRAEFLGKCSPVHFFWGSFDLAVTRFSGRRAPDDPTRDAVTREAYSHEVSSVGFWPGGGAFADAAFYAYAAPAPPGFRDAPVRPAAAHWDATLGEFLLPYAELRRAPAPDAALLDFCRSTYAAAADLGQWDRAALERR